ncbi:MAG: hypothetical protein Q9219_006686 [cf. Caloplaca sp. 3 TL-2023]
MDYAFRDKVVLITGSSQGLGRATAIKFAQAGTRLVACADLHPGRKPSVQFYSNFRRQDLSNLEATVDTSHKDEDDKLADAPAVGTPKTSTNSMFLQSGLKDVDNDDDSETPTHELICTRYGEGKAIYIECDVSREKDTGGMSSAIEKVVREGGKLNVYESSLNLVFPL